MRDANPFRHLLAAATLGGLSLPAAFGVAEAAAGEPPAAKVVSGTWQHHKVTMNYFGITSLYTCDGLESRVRQILLYMGAREDLKVRATGCPGPFNAPSRSAWVNADFYSLAPAPDGGAPGAVQAHWTALELQPRQPRFMGEGDCELMQSMKDLALKNFSLRDVDYRTDCVPHELNLDGFSIKGEVLKAGAPATQVRSG
jgi:hypothetical protein